MVRLLALVVAGFALSSCAASAAPPPIKHVFVIVLENKDASKTFAPDSPAPYLSKTLRSQGVYIPGYYGIGHYSLTNYVAMVSGQAPNSQTQGDCQIYTEMLPGTPGPDGQAIGQGCVHPMSVKTVADQLEAKGLSWKGYMEDMGNDPARETPTCGHPAIGAQDDTQSATPKDQYATRHDPFVYFHTIIDDQARCDAHVVRLDRLSADLGSAATTPNYSFITPDLCHDGHDATCADGGPGGLQAADDFLQTWVPKIVNAPAFKDGLLVVTFDEAEKDSSACCNEQSGPNTPSPGGAQPGPGGGRTGAVLLSPYIKPGTATPQPYNHYALLRSVEDLFGLNHLGYAGQAGLAPFGDDVYSNDAGTTAAAVAAPAALGAPVRGCRIARLAGRPRALPARTMLQGLRLRRSAGRRVVSFRTLHGARLTVRSAGARPATLRARACRAYRLTLARGSRGTVRVTAATGTHAERRALR
ncbi:MAG: alkaline phosphatase family protein [Solirubrobacteraceae bacterium]